MPPVRWKRIAVLILYFIHIALAARTPKDFADDGWKPIIGHTNFDVESVYYQSSKNEKSSVRDSVAMDIKNSYIVATPKPTASLSINSISSQHGHSHLHKMSSTNKQPVIYPSAQGYNVQKPMNVIAHRSQTKLYKVPAIGKNHMSVSAGAKRVLKPIRVQSEAYNQKDEVLAPASSTGLGNYAFFNPALGSIKTRHSHPSTDYLNHFAAHNSDLLQFQRLPIQQYVLPKNQAQNDVRFSFQAQNDEYSRNLVPPPPSKKYAEKEKPNDKPIIFKQKEQINSATEPAQTHKQRIEQSQLLSDTALFQVPPPYQQTAYYIPATNEQTVDVQVTKENIKEFHNNIPYQQPQDLIYNSAFANYQFGKKPTETPRIPTYEVTEEKYWQEISPSYQQHFLQEVKKIEKTKRPTVKEQTKHIEPFLPTPMKPFNAIPTSPTQGEISTIFTELSQKISRQKENLDSGFFNVKEVSTHYPILGRPNVGQFSVQSSLPVYDNEDFPNEITTIKPRDHFKIKQIKQSEVPTELQTTTIPTTTISLDWQQKRRPVHRRRRPINRNKLTTEEPFATTIYYNFQKDVEETTVHERRRRPVQAQRTTETPGFIEKPTKRMRNRQRIRPTLKSVDEEMPHNHKMSFTEDVSQPIRGSYTYKTSLDNTRKRPVKYYDSDISENISGEEEYSTSTKYNANSRNKGNKPRTHYSEEQLEENGDQLETYIQETNEEVYESNKKANTKPLYEEPTTVIATEKLELTTNAEKEDIENDNITIKEIYTENPDTPEEETTLATTTSTSTTTTTTTIEPKTTIKGNRFRRPIHYKPSRPKFSVKDYHQRLNQYISSTEIPKVTTESTRSRYRTRKPLLKQEDEQETTETTKRRFIPKNQRQSLAFESKDEPVETSVKTVNSRIRPFGRQRSTTTEAATTQKNSIKPHIFNTLRRPPPVSLKDRIQNRYNKLNNTERNIKPENNEKNEMDVTTTVEVSQVPTSTETVTTVKYSDITTVATATEQEPEVENDKNKDVNETEIFKNAALMHSQRVSDLTSSTQNQYNTPGMFKNVSPNVRRVPNYFTLATEDPILPIEAFFPNLNKEKY
ncbi:hypothetical protein Trydic_g4315 [Trypoxylus dichotomus]